MLQRNAWEDLEGARIKQLGDTVKKYLLRYAQTKVEVTMGRSTKNDIFAVKLYVAGVDYYK